LLHTNTVSNVFHRTIDDSSTVATYNISFIGAGNVAESLCHGLAAAGHRIASVASKGGESARLLADSTGAEWRKDLSLPPDCDIVILAVTDNVVCSSRKKP